jgi:hypothetical protein
MLTLINKLVALRSMLTLINELVTLKSMLSQRETSIRIRIKRQ